MRERGETDTRSWKVQCSVLMTGFYSEDKLPSKGNRWQDQRLGEQMGRFLCSPGGKLSRTKLKQ